MKETFLSIKGKVVALVIIIGIVTLSELFVYAEETLVTHSPPSIICTDSTLEVIESFYNGEEGKVGLDSVHETAALRQNMYVRWFGPSNFDECVEDNIKKVSSEIAARAVYASCKQLFDNPLLSEAEKKYHNCVLKNMKGVSTDMAARIIMQNCRKKNLGE